ncbi:MAG: VWA domain-containing protein [Acidobacteria bacterium]|nr:VWA domain-containing protein [Acidobacteriota bacterium]MBI3423214.1 VWA domain-containing protein [Acidobacteriota bacterium]
MYNKAISKISITVLFLLLASWRVASHPAYQNMYANDPRSKPELRTDCTICHAIEGKASQPNFLSEFGKAFKTNRNRLSDELRTRFPRLFNQSDNPVSGVPVETLKMATAQVVINISVTDAKGKFVTGLDKDAFKLSEDQQQQEMVEFLGEDAPLAVAVLVDTSGSALEADLQKARNAVLDLANRLRPNDVLAVYTFGEGGVQMVRDYSQGVKDLKPLLKKLQGQGNTPLFDAVLNATEDLRKRPERRRALVLISDGADSESQATLRETEKQTFLAGVSIYAIDLINTQKSARRSAERQAAAQVLQQLTEVTGGRYITTDGGFFLLTSRAKLKRIFTDLIDEWHSQYTITYEPNNVRQQGRWRTLRVQLEQADLTARTRLGYREAVQ